MDTIMNKLRGLFTIAIVIVTALNTNVLSQTENDSDSANYIIIAGKVTDLKTGKPVLFTNAYLGGSNIGTVTNTEGDFILKIPVDDKNGKISFSSIGYKSVIIALNQLKPEGNEIQLEPLTIPIDEVIIRTNDPVELLKDALEKVPENYHIIPENMTAFYRETIKQNRSYVAVSEAILDIYKAPYSRQENDQVKIFKGRKSEDVKKMDTVIFKLQGGPNTMVLLDVLKNPNVLLDPEAFEYYDYELLGILNVEQNPNYVIQFDQKDKVDYPLYSGKIYLDTDNLAVTALEFNLSEKGINKAANVLVRKKPLTMKVEPLSAYYVVNYRQEDDGKWYLNHVRSELVIKCKWQRRLFNSTYTAMSEMAVTDKTNKEVQKFSMKEITRPSDVFVENVGAYYDENFWEDFNYIKPEEPIQNAIEKINRKIKRRLSSIE